MFVLAASVAKMACLKTAFWEEHNYAAHCTVGSVIVFLPKCCFQTRHFRHAGCQYEHAFSLSSPLPSILNP